MSCASSGVNVWLACSCISLILPSSAFTVTEWPDREGSSWFTYLRQEAHHMLADRS